MGVKDNKSIKGIIIITEMVLFMYVMFIGVSSVYVSGFLRVYIGFSIGRRMNGREYENMHEKNSVMA